MSMDINKCRLESEKRWAALEVEMQKLKDTQETMETRLDKQAAMVSDIQKLSSSVSILANNMQSMLEEQKQQSARLRQLEGKPAKRWDMVVEKVILLVITALVTYALLQMGLPA